MFYIALITSKLINLIIDTFKLGAGFTWPGHIALKLKPDLISNDRFKYPKGSVYISGTNGKTTTSKLITHILKKNNYKVVHNNSGANLLNGVASAMLMDCDIWGNPKSDTAVFEVDEFVLPYLLEQREPSILVLLNLSRDQLDRYGETDIISERWKKSIITLKEDTILVLDSTQSKFSDYPNNFKGSTVTFDADMSNLASTSLVGEFNAKNVNAAVLVSEMLGIPKYLSLDVLKDFDAAYGRGEIINKKDKSFKVFLAKNPTSFNNNLDVLLDAGLIADTLLFILNDDPRDGRDVSWIYDIDPKKLSKVCVGKKIYVSGSRYLDMAVRINYAEAPLPEENVIYDLSTCVENIFQNEATKNVLVFPNYSAMLAVRKLLVGREIL